MAKAIWDHFVLDQTWKEIGDSLGRSARAAESLVGQFVQKLREDLKEWEGGCTPEPRLRFKRFVEEP